MKALILTIGGPVSNLVLASGGIIFVLLLIKTDLLLIGTAVFGYYLIGLTAIYLMMSEALRLIGLARIFQAVILVEGFAFALCLATYLYLL